MTQYPLSLSLPAVYSEANFALSECNRTAHDAVMRWPDWHSHAMILTGETGSGKTHLGHLWAQKSGADVLEARELNEPLSGHALIEHIEQADARTLFHALNYAKENGKSLLLTSKVPLQQLPFDLPDLTSRLKALSQATIAPPDDEALASAMRKQFADRQLKVEEEVIAYLVPRIERSFAEASAWVARLDAAAMAQKKNITVPFVREHLAAG